ncbi:MAG: aspartate kinase, partial [Bacilli bacterium]
MDIKVIKFGGSSVATLEKISHLASLVALMPSKVVIVISAMGKKTDDLLGMVNQINPLGSKRDVDLLLAIGEQQSAALMSLSIQSHQKKSIALTGMQAGIKTTGPFLKGNIEEIDAQLFHDYFATYDVIVVAGFQGVNEQLQTQTLGRGGSDTSAVAIAASLKAPCYIYTDVEGVYTIDPRLYQEAKQLKVISYDEMIELSISGSAVLEPRCVEIAKKYNVELYVGQLTSEKEGTWIRKESVDMEKKEVVGLSLNSKVVKYTITNINNFDLLIEGFYDYLVKANLVVQQMKH